MPAEDDPRKRGYDWLFRPSPDTADDGAPQPRKGDPEPTKMIRAERPPHRAAPSGGNPTDAPPSFGGTYPRARSATPPPSTAPRPAAPRPSAAPSAAPPAARPAFRSGAGRPQPVRASPARALSSPPAGSSPAPAPSRTRRRRRFRWWRLLLALLAAWLVFLVVVPIYAWSKVTKVDAEPSGARPADGPGTTYLLVGSDSREGLTAAQEHDLGTGAAAGQRTDTIIVLHVSDSSGPNVMLSIPRDSLVSVPGHGQQKINAAYAYGGPKLLVQTVELATGIKVDDYVEVGFTGVVDVVDAVGGITVCPKTSIVDPLAGNLRMKAGCQSVDGHVALDYSRSRAFPLGDITRAFHQREVIAATGSKAASWQTVAFPWRYWKLNVSGAESVRIGDNVGPFAFARFAWAMAHSSGPGTVRCVVPYSTLGASTSVGSAVLWDKPKADALFGAIQSDDTADVHCQGQ